MISVIPRRWASQWGGRIPSWSALRELLTWYLILKSPVDFNYVSRASNALVRLYRITVTSLWARWRLKSQRLDCSKKTSKRRVNGLCGRNSLVTSQFPAQRASNAENVSIWWRHHDMTEYNDGSNINGWQRTCPITIKPTCCIPPNFCWT